MESALIELLAQHDAANRCSRMLSTEMARQDWPEVRRITGCAPPVMRTSIPPAGDQMLAEVPRTVCGRTGRSVGARPPRRTHRIPAGRSATRHGRGRSNSPVCRRTGRCSGSTGGKRRPDPHGQGSSRPSFSVNSVSTPTTRSPRLTLDSLEGTPDGAYWSDQKDASAS
jgi:hypothetical protein